MKKLMTVIQIFNKVAGVYGLIAALTGAGGSFPQISLYLYSTLGLIALAWGLRAVHDVRIYVKTVFAWNTN
jgi:inositol phosphorylceramide synthase regulatory subunit